MLELMAAVLAATLANTTPPRMKAPRPPPPSAAIATPVAAPEGDEADAPEPPSGDDPPASTTTGFRYQFSQSQRVELGDGRTRVSVEQGLVGPRAGWAPLRVAIDNTSGPRQVISLTFRGFGGGGANAVSRSLEVPEGANLAVTLPVPASLRNGTLEARGPGITANAGARPVYLQNLYGNGRAIVTIGKPEQFQKYVGQPPDFSAAENQVVAFSLEQAPSELAPLVGYDAVVVPELAVLDKLGEAQKRALEQYAATGGTLVLPGGLRDVAWLPLLEPHSTPHSRYGLGELFQGVGVHALQGLDDDLVVSPEGAPPAWERRYGGRTWDALLPQATAPVGAFLLIMTLFTLLIGPGSVVVARRRGPSALLFTIPTTAFLTCAAIIGYSLVSDGFTIHAASFGYTLLDSKEHRAVTAGLAAYYANLSPREARFPGGQVPLGAWKNNAEAGAVSADWKDGLRLGAEYLPSRSYREWGYVAVEATRARLVLKRQGDGWVVQNALGQRLREVRVNLDGDVLQASDLADGAEGRLVKTDGLALGLSGKLNDRFPERVREIFRTVSADGQFVGVLVGPGFVPQGGLSATQHESESMIRGEVER